MRHGNKELIVVGDRVLVRVEEGEERTNVGLYLPSTALDSQAVQGGTIVATGTPEDVARVDASHTGRYLRGLLEPPARRRKAG